MTRHRKGAGTSRYHCSPREIDELMWIWIYDVTLSVP